MCHFIVDEFFKENEVFELDLKNDDELFFVETSKKEPTTAYINQLKDVIENRCSTQPCAIVGIGGGSTMDVIKAISNFVDKPRSGRGIIKVGTSFQIQEYLRLVFQYYRALDLRPQEHVL